MGIPLPALDWMPLPGESSGDTSGRLTLVAAPGSDWSNDAFGTARQHDAALLGFTAPDRFSLSARASVEGPRTTFDAPSLSLWASPDHWAKLCFERSPQGTDMVVSVVTDRFSDDCNGPVVAAGSVLLRVVRDGHVWAFHSSADGEVWDFVRLFRFEPELPVTVGFMAQSPMGGAFEVVFDEIVFDLEIPTDYRDGS
ncbi:DUF1349 domain-containing protein [Microbacterium sp. 2FI]|uniref:DUF1349 domain-containing protein n=1 Tax=Microbacterium sp. 2FI TaxID=2502193 RepID=UPI0010F4B535|nr:DUF1349 domain-containing protein [Microbacterium sp. 2FI]